MRHIAAMSLCMRFGKAKKLSVMARAYSLSTAVFLVWMPSAGKSRASASGLIYLCMGMWVEEGGMSVLCYSGEEDRKGRRREAGRRVELHTFLRGGVEGWRTRRG